MAIVFTKKPGQQIFKNFTVEQVGEQLTAGATIVDESGAPVQVVEFMGGLLVGPFALPLNVLLYGEWRPGQKEIFEPLWQSGQFPRPPADILALPVVEESKWGIGTIAAGVVVFVLARTVLKR